MYGSVATIIGSGGTLAPAALVAMQMLTTASYAAYGGSEIVEGLGNVQLGFAGDFQTAANNPTLHTLFGGNRDYYNLWGTASGLASLGLTYAASKYPMQPVEEFVASKEINEILETNKSPRVEELEKLIKNGKVKDNNIISQIDDSTQIIFRDDTGANAHAINSKGYSTPIDHYNIEIQTRTKAGKWKSKWSYHIILDDSGNIIKLFD